MSMYYVNESCLNVNHSSLRVSRPHDGDNGGFVRTHFFRKKDYDVARHLLVIGLIIRSYRAYVQERRMSTFIHAMMNAAILLLMFAPIAGCFPSFGVNFTVRAPLTVSNANALLVKTGYMPHDILINTTFWRVPKHPSTTHCKVSQRTPQ